MEEQVTHSSNARTAIAISLVLLGFAGILVYMTYALFYPVLSPFEFSVLASYNDMQQILLNRYLGHIHYLILGIASAIAGIWLYFGKKQVANESSVFAS